MSYFGIWCCRKCTKELRDGKPKPEHDCRRDAIEKHGADAVIRKPFQITTREAFCLADKYEKAANQ